MEPDWTWLPVVSEEEGVGGHFQMSGGLTHYPPQTVTPALIGVLRSMSVGRYEHRTSERSRACLHCSPRDVCHRWLGQTSNKLLQVTSIPPRR